jgi:hypothetical protein
MSETTVNGFEISQPREQLTAPEFRMMSEEYGIIGANPAERVEAFKRLPAENVAFYLTDLNRRLQGSDETLIHEETMKIGGQETIAPEDRAVLFTGLLDGIKRAKGVNPARIGDALGLGVVTLHPFKDGNGRTARLMGLLFRDEYDDPGYKDIFEFLTQSKEELMNKGVGTRPVGYIPYFPEGASGSNAEDVSIYLESLLSQNEGRLYNGPAGQEPLIAIKEHEMN